MGYVRITVQLTEEEIAKIDKASEVQAARKEGSRISRSNVIREGALAYANELLGIKSKKEKE